MKKFIALVLFLLPGAAWADVTVTPAQIATQQALVAADKVTLLKQKAINDASYAAATTAYSADLNALNVMQATLQEQTASAAALLANTPQ